MNAPPFPFFAQGQAENPRVLVAVYEAKLRDRNWPTSQRTARHAIRELLQALKEATK